jgi:hypothetical protein
MAKRRDADCRGAAEKRLAREMDHPKAVAQVVRIVSEMDRYHGFFPRRARAPVRSRRLALPAQEPPALPPPPQVRRDGKVAVTD